MVKDNFKISALSITDGSHVYSGTQSVEDYFTNVITDDVPLGTIYIQTGSSDTSERTEVGFDPITSYPLGNEVFIKVTRKADATSPGQWSRVLNEVQERWKKINADYTADSYDRLLADFAGSGDAAAPETYTITLPDFPFDGDEVYVYPSTNSSYTTDDKVVLVQSGQTTQVTPTTIAEDPGPITVDTTGMGYQFVYEFNSNNWRIYQTSTLNFSEFAALASASAGNIIFGTDGAGTSSTTNADEVSKSGFYQADGDAAGVPYANTSGWTGFTSASPTNDSSGTINESQVFIDQDTGTMYTRTIVDGVAQPWSQVWTDQNDGTDSGLNADKLDGLDSTDFVRANQDDTVLSNLTLQDGLVISNATGDATDWWTINQDAVTGDLVFTIPGDGTPENPPVTMTFNEDGGMEINGSPVVTQEDIAGGDPDTNPVTQAFDERYLNTTDATGDAMAGELTLNDGLVVQGADTGITFDDRYDQRIDLYTSPDGTESGIGVQPETVYVRTEDNFAIYKDGAPSATELDPGTDGVALFTIDGTTMTTTSEGTYVADTIILDSTKDAAAAASGDSNWDDRVALYDNGGAESYGMAFSNVGTPGSPEYTTLLYAEPDSRISFGSPGALDVNGDPVLDADGNPVGTNEVAYFDLADNSFNTTGDINQTDGVVRFGTDGYATDGSQDATLTSTDHPFQLGSDMGDSIIMDPDTIQSKTWDPTLNGGTGGYATNDLYLNPEGGAVYLGGTGPENQVVTLESLQEVSTASGNRIIKVRNDAAAYPDSTNFFPFTGEPNRRYAVDVEKPQPSGVKQGALFTLPDTADLTDMDEIELIPISGDYEFNYLSIRPTGTSSIDGQVQNFDLDFPIGVKLIYDAENDDWVILSTHNFGN